MTKPQICNHSSFNKIGTHTLTEGSQPTTKACQHVYIAGMLLIKMKIGPVFPHVFRRIVIESDRNAVPNKGRSRC